MTEEQFNEIRDAQYVDELANSETPMPEDVAKLCGESWGCPSSFRILQVTPLDINDRVR